jgi:hypothetical protein
MFKDVETSVILLYIGAAGVGAYFLYKLIANATNSPANIDPTTGTSNGVLNGIMTSLFPAPNPGGGAVAGSSETYTGAASTFLSDPVGTIESIFGIGDAGTSTGTDPSTMGNDTGEVESAF